MGTGFFISGSNGVVSCIIKKIDITGTILDFSTQSSSACKIGAGGNYDSSKLNITDGITLNCSTATAGWNSDSDKK